MNAATYRAMVFLLASSWAGAEPSEEKTMRAQINALVLDDLKNGSAPKPVLPISKDGPKQELHTLDPVESATPAVVLPKIVVEAERITKLKQDMAEQDHLIAQEAKHTEPSALDSALNAPGISFKIFGGFSSEMRAANARHRVEVMSWERIVIIAIAEAKTEKEKEEWRKMLREMHGYRQ